MCVSIDQNPVREHASGRQNPLMRQARVLGHAGANKTTYTYGHIRMSHSGSKVQYKADTTNHVLWDAYVYILYDIPYIVLQNTYYYILITNYVILDHTITYYTKMYLLYCEDPSV